MKTKDKIEKIELSKIQIIEQIKRANKQMIFNKPKSNSWHYWLGFKLAYTELLNEIKNG